MLDSSFNASDVLGIAFQTVSVKPFTSMALVAGDDATGDPASEFLSFPWYFLFVD